MKTEECDAPDWTIAPKKQTRRARFHLRGMITLDSDATRRQ